MRAVGILLITQLCCTSFFSTEQTEPEGSLNPPSYEASISAAAMYFDRRRNELDLENTVLFEFLHRKFEQPWAKPIVQRYTEEVRDGPPSVVTWTIRMVDESYDQYPGLDDAIGTDRLLVPALYCRERPFSEDKFFTTLSVNTRLGGNELVHAAGAQEWAYELGCIEHTGRWKVLREEQVRRLADEAAEFTRVEDLFVNILSMLYYVGAPQDVRPEWLARIVQEQHEDGGWGIGGSDDHTTLHALWTLLEANDPRHRRVPMIKAH